VYESTNEIANQNKLLHANEERYPILIGIKSFYWKIECLPFGPAT